jgi:hypothetical protein
MAVQVSRTSGGGRVCDGDIEVVGVAVLDDMSIDLPQPRPPAAVIEVNAFAIFRDVEVLVAEGTQVEISRGFQARNRSKVPSSDGTEHQVVRIHAHTMLGSVTGRITYPSSGSAG